MSVREVDMTGKGAGGVLRDLELCESERGYTALPAMGNDARHDQAQHASYPEPTPCGPSINEAELQTTG